MPGTFNIAQLNIAKFKNSLDDAGMKEFVDKLDPVNAVAESTPGFIWRLKDETNTQKFLTAFDESTVVNMSVWKSIDDLYNYAYSGDHLTVLRRKKEWFDKHLDVYMVMWYIPEGHIPTISEAKERLDHLRTNGETPYAFTFKKKFSLSESLEYKKS